MLSAHFKQFKNNTVHPKQYFSKIKEHFTKVKILAGYLKMLRAIKTNISPPIFGSKNIFVERN